MRRLTKSVLGGLIGGVLTFIFPAPTYATMLEGKLKELADILSKTIEVLLGIGAGFALLFVVIGGIQYMASGGDEKSVSSAKNTITYSIAGLVVILGAILAINVLGDIFGF